MKCIVVRFTFGITVVFCRGTALTARSPSVNAIDRVSRLPLQLAATPSRKGHRRTQARRDGRDHATRPVSLHTQRTTSHHLPPGGVATHHPPGEVARAGSPSGRQLQVQLSHINFEDIHITVQHHGVVSEPFRCRNHVSDSIPGNMSCKLRSLSFKVGYLRTHDHSLRVNDR
jgi:hypothetical protein